MKVSVIVPLHRATAASELAIQRTLELRGHDVEVVVVSDTPTQLPDDERIVPVVTGLAGDSSPAEKRDIGFQASSGDFVAYLDDDAFPDSRWLDVASREFEDPSVQAVGGPGMTPPGSSWRARLGGAIYESPLGSGPLGYRFRPRPPRIVDDYPAYNLIVRRKAVERAGGWGTRFYGGEDSFFCERLAETGSMIHYVPDLIVYHHRRRVFGAHMRQVRNIGVHRGYFARMRIGGSRRLVYFLPTASLVLLVCSTAMLLTRGRRHYWVVAAASYAALGASAPKDLPVAGRLLFPAALLVHHASYGSGFVRGFFTRNLRR